MIDLTGVSHHPAMEDIVSVLCNKTQNTDKGFFRAEVAFFLGKMASCMRTVIVTKDRGEIPVNIYALALANSGYGKGHSVNIMEVDFLGGFKKRFIETTMPVVADKNLWAIANKRAVSVVPSMNPQEAYDKVLAIYNRTGAYPFTFDSGTPEGVKQLRHKLLMADAGSINLQIDEIGSKLLANTDVLTVFLELYDQGLVKQKLVKNTNDNERDEEIDGKTPTNMLLFGTPVKLFDGSDTENEFYSFLETGYARRCLFGWGQPIKRAMHQMTPREIFEHLISPANSQLVDKWATHFSNLADPAKFGCKIIVEDDVAIKLLEYKIQCDEIAEKLPDHEEIRKAELSHRYFKALKLAGAYAFVDESLEVEMDHLLQAIKLVEESGEAFSLILSREKTYVKLAKYIATCGTEVTHADLHEALPFYKQSGSARNELMTLATAWGYKQHILIRKSFVDGIEFFRGETLEKTNLDELIISYSSHWAYNYLADRAPFTKLHLLTQTADQHFANHHFVNGHRADEHVIPGFNCIIIDVDHGTPLATAVDLLKDYKFMMYTTKRHTPEANRFRVILPINYKLELDTDEYREFMINFMKWLPFEVDEQAKDRSRKWQTFDKGQFLYNEEGEILDALRFVPKTQKNEQFQQDFRAIESLSNLERWFAQRIAQGNRNNNMLKFAMALVDGGLNLMDVEKAVYAFNDKLTPGLPRQEIAGTIMKSVAKRYIKNTSP
jgi:hypothetical protein